MARMMVSISLHVLLSHYIVENEEQPEDEKCVNH